MTFPVDSTQIINDDYEDRKMSLYARNGDVYLVAHHAVAYTVDQIVDTFNSASRTVSANFAIGPHRAGVDDYKIIRTVPENKRAYTTASWVDDQALTFEMANLSMGGRYPVGQSGKQIAAELAAYMHTEYNMPLDRWHVTCHQEVYQRGWGSYPTACPGDDLHDSLDWIVAEAKRIVASQGGGTGGKEVKSYYRQDATARSKAGRTIKQGEGAYLHTTVNAPVSNATNIVGGVGTYAITSNIYATGAPGDAIDVVLVWQNTKAKPVSNSRSYTQRFVFDKNGVIRESGDWKRGVAAGYAVYARVEAPATNTKPVKVNVFDTAAYLFLS